MIPVSVSGIVIAAGLSERMGSFKPLNMFNGENYLYSIIKKLSCFCSEIIIVTGFNSALIEDSLRNSQSSAAVKTVYNPEYEKGMFTSLKKGISRCMNRELILYHFVDQPFLPENFYEEFINEYEPGIDWLQPYYSGRGGHPLLLGRNTVSAILDEDDNSNLRIIKAKKEIIKKEWQCHYKGVLADFDTPDDVENYGK